MNDRPESAPASETSRAEIELDQLDLRYEGHRLRQRGREERLLASMAREGIREPLAGAVVESAYVLLDGFKRWRCARQLHVHRVPFVTLGADETSAILELLGRAQRSRLSVVEEARFLDELKARGLSLAEMAEALGRSKAWVSLRLGLLESMSPVVRQHVFDGGLPVYSWIYSLAAFRRLNGVTVGQVEEFVGAVSGRGLSVRQIEQLAHGYFRGPESFRQELRRGHLTLLLQQMAAVPADPDGCSEFERILVGDLELIQKHAQRVVGKSQDRRLQSRAFFVQCHLLTGGLLSRAKGFLQILKQLHDRSRKA
jgi:ParB/RepB/Spo0J family partition protein